MTVKSPAHRAGPSRMSVRFEKSAIWTSLCGLVMAICAVKVLTLSSDNGAPIWGVYSIVVTSYIGSRFLLAACYRPDIEAMADEELPSVAIVVPAYNEPEGIRDTLLGCLGVDYPRHLLKVVVVDDKSTDTTLRSIREIEASHPQLAVAEHVINRGKRQAMATGVRLSGDAEVLVFIDSDSLVEPDALRKLVRYFRDPSVGAVAGHTDVWNKNTNILTKMQAVRYYVAFRVYKSAEALFSSVTCCSGCFSGYRRSAVDAVLDPWLGQRFLGKESTYGDDRSLTNFLLPNWRILYAPDAQAHTTVPDSMDKFLRQQLRWKKSWIRESLRASKIMWRKHPVFSVGFYLGIILPLLAPQVVLRSLVIQPYFLGTLPLWYLGGVLAMSALYGLYYRKHRREALWKHGILFALFYTAVLVWQFPYALATLRDSKWGTR